MIFIIYYLISISFVGGCLFAYDKHAAISKKRRIPEKTLHLTEFAGAVFAIWILMYLLHHKNKKAGYFAITYLILLMWIAGTIFINNVTKII